MTILTKQSACDEKAPVKIAIPPEEPNQHQPEGEVPLNNNNNNTIIYAHYQQRKRRTLVVLLLGLIMSLSLFLFMASYYEPRPRQDAFLQRFRCEVGEDGVPHFQEITGNSDKDEAYFPFSVRVFRIWLPNLFDLNGTSIDNGNDESDLLKSDAFFGGSQTDDDDDEDLDVSDGEKSNMFREELSFNKHDTEQILTVDFLDFKNGRSGRFIHALSANQTAIVDKSHNRCFVMPLDPDTNIIPEDILNMSNDKDLNTERVRKNMEIVTPKLEDLSDLSPRIQQQCAGMNVYKLEKHNSELFKRDASPVARYSELAGNKWIDLNIVNADRLEDLE